MVSGFRPKQSLPYTVLQSVKEKNRNCLIINNDKIKVKNQGLQEMFIEDK